MTHSPTGRQDGNRLALAGGTVASRGECLHRWSMSAESLAMAVEAALEGRRAS